MFCFDWVELSLTWMLFSLLKLISIFLSPFFRKKRAEIALSTLLALCW